MERFSAFDLAAAPLAEEISGNKKASPNANGKRLTGLVERVTGRENEIHLEVQLTGFGRNTKHVGLLENNVLQPANLCVRLPSSS